MQNKNLAILFVLGIAVVLGAMFFLPQQKPKETVPPVEETVPSVESATDLNLVESDLDSTDLDQMDPELNQIDSYSSEF